MKKSAWKDDLSLQEIFNHSENSWESLQLFDLICKGHRNVENISRFSFSKEDNSNV